jgi:hypothetical protein
MESACCLIRSYHEQSNNNENNDSENDASMLVSSVSRPPGIARLVCNSVYVVRLSVTATAKYRDKFKLKNNSVNPKHS